MITRGVKRPFASAGVRAAFTLIVSLILFMAGSTARAAHAPVDLGTADSFAVLGGQTVTNTGPSVISGSVGVSPGSAITGFPPGLVNNGTIHAANATAAQAQADLTTAYNDAAGRTCTTDLTGQNLGGMTLTDGTYCFSSEAQLTGTVTLDAQGVSSAVFIFQIGSDLTTASASTVSLINGAQACNVYWQVGASAALGTTTTFRGSILALTSISLNTGATIVEGRALARNGSVTLDTNTITRDTCRTPAPAPTAPTAMPAPGLLSNTSVSEQITAQGSGVVPAVLAGVLLIAALSLIAVFRRRNS